MKIASGTRVFSAALGLAWLAVGGPAAAQEKPKGDVEVTVEVEGGKALKSCAVYVRNQRVDVAEAGKPVLAKGVPQGRAAVLADAQVSDGLFKGTRRYLGVVEAGVNPGPAAKVKVTVKPVDDLDAFCLACHPDGRDKTRRVEAGQIPRDIHVSNKPLGEKHLKQLRKYNDTAARLAKEGKPHNLGIPTEERTAKVGGKDVKQTFFTCESCHTLHLETPHTDYARAPFRAAPDLCVGCHD